MGFKMFLFLLVVVLSVNSFRGLHWRKDRRPRIYGESIPYRAIQPSRKKLQQRIVMYHNYFRTRVVPRAANMLKMKWHRGASKAAQKWSEECMLLTHDNITGRHIKNYGSCGQNIFISSHQVPWLFAIKTWFLEKDNFTYGSKKNNLTLVGHYTQMIWATTHEVGCGLSKCYRNGNVTGKLYYNYICNYCPIGNRPFQISKPYRKGRPCGLCKKHCHPNGLCLNSCRFADLWANCKELYNYWPQWLCNTYTAKGKDRTSSCKATCKCRGKIHD